MKQNRYCKVILVAGTRPNFMKVAPLIRAIDAFNNSMNQIKLNKILVHTGQHYDFNMSDSFFKDLELTKPDIYIGVGSCTQGEQTGRILIEFEKICFKEKPNIVIVVGDVNSTLACTLAASKLHIPIAHVESGLRSFDRKMPEEINRVVTDALSSFLFTTSKDANNNLKKQGIDSSKIFLVGNVMIDSLVYHKEHALRTNILKYLGLISHRYAILTLHRPSNVDNKKSLEGILKTLKQVSKKLPIIFPIHPRTRNQIEAFGLSHYLNYISMPTTRNIYPVNSIVCIDPVGYLEFINLMINAKFVLTDSGGIQEETTFLGIPCLTLRDSTERPVTIKKGTNKLVGNNPERIIREAEKIISSKSKKGVNIPYWDGKAAERIVNIIHKAIGDYID